MNIVWDIDFVYRAFLIFMRLGALLFSIPFFNASGIPTMAKIGFALLLTNLVAVVLPEHPTLPANAMGMVCAGCSEVMLGLFMGLIIRCAFQTVSMASEIISIEGGFMRDNSFDPFQQQQGTAMERLLYNFAVVIFLTTGMHLEVFSNFVKSFEVAHLGQWIPSAGSIRGLISATSQIFIVAVQMAAPFIALNFVINMTFAVLGKAVPQMNVFIISFAVLIVGGLVTFMMTLDVTAQYVITLMGESARNMLLLTGAK
jgi:flagellar biosynthetic protein FliR